MQMPLSSAEDVTYMKALEADDSSAKTASVNGKVPCVMHSYLQR